MTRLPEGIKMRFDHVSIAVKSIDLAYNFFQRYFPIHLRSEKTPSEQTAGFFYWKDFHLGGFTIELIEDPPRQDGFVNKFIARHGEGFHHLSIEVNSLPPVLEALKAGGARIVDEQKFDSGAMTAFISPRSAFGALIQFWQVPDFDAPQNPIPRDGLAHFDHAALAVRDIDKAIDFFSRYFPSRLLRAKHVSNSEGNFTLAQMEVAGFKLEFLQSPPRAVENDFVGRFIERHGEGIHHISIDLKEFDAMRDRLKADGIRVVDEKTNRRGERQFFVSPRSAFGTLIQLWDGI